ncbi:hypothetical protein [Roseimicrobium sp. ORNL1]|uniref:hypothetical protein n=1 Tax=Roseimicrobium sp. ORNL1 TaxID=2711231 RepID=UPI0013E10949|nr:hypothetical protein [Roseimicrobium sp. ORNL1]QIF01727.1 hypothetical protein G5S37_09385 [Roseimicrobium sp. ORNL1]
MSSTSSSRSHVLMWCLGALLLPPLLYVLSVPAVLRCASIKWHPQDLKYSRKVPQWVQTYCTPYNRVLDSDTILKKPLEGYTGLWGYKRNPTTMRAEETARKIEEARAQIKEVQERMEKKLGRPLGIKPPPSLPPRAPPPYLDLEPAATPRASGGASRKSP